jgi:voltage-gated potassium channel
MHDKPQDSALRLRIREIIFGTSTPAGKAFDVVLIVTIIASVIAIMLDSVEGFSQRHHQGLFQLEWFFTLLFTVEYALRIYSSPHPTRYMRSFFGIIDLLAILPTYLSLFEPSLNYLMVIRVLRVLRIFRVLKLMRYLNEASVLLRAMRASGRKIFVFFIMVFTCTCIFGTIMYLLEAPHNGFTSIPKSIYWAIVTITTVGYGDIAPQSVLGQALAAMVMMTGYAIIAVPTGIISAEIYRDMRAQRDFRECLSCRRSGHEHDANYCRFCGFELEKTVPEPPDHS